MFDLSKTLFSQVVLAVAVAMLTVSPVLGVPVLNPSPLPEPDDPIFADLIVYSIKNHLDLNAYVNLMPPPEWEEEPMPCGTGSSEGNARMNCGPEYFPITCPDSPKVKIPIIGTIVEPKCFMDYYGEERKISSPSRDILVQSIGHCALQNKNLTVRSGDFTLTNPLNWDDNEVTISKTYCKKI